MTTCSQLSDFFWGGGGSCSSIILGSQSHVKRLFDITVTGLLVKEKGYATSACLSEKTSHH